MSTPRPTAEILRAVIDRLKTVLWTGPNGPERAFADETIKPFTGTDLVKAIQALLITQTRAAYVILERNTWEDTISGQEVRIRRSIRLWVVVTDRVIGDETAALLGTAVLEGGVRNPNSAPTPGAQGLADLVVTQLTGQLIGNPQGVRLLPEATDPMLVKIEKTDAPGRAAVAVQFRAQGGWQEAELPPKGPTV